MKKYLPAFFTLFLLIGTAFVFFRPWNDPEVQKLLSKDAPLLWGCALFVFLYIPWLVFLFDHLDPWCRRVLSQITGVEITLAPFGTEEPRPLSRWEIKGHGWYGFCLECLQPVMYAVAGLFPLLALVAWVWRRAPV